MAAVLGSAGLRQLRLASPAFQPAAAFPVCGPGPRTRPGYTNLSSGAVTLESHWSLQHNSVTVCRGHGVGWAGLRYQGLLLELEMNLHEVSFTITEKAPTRA